MAKGTLRVPERRCAAAACVGERGRSLLAGRPARRLRPWCGRTAGRRGAGGRRGWGSMSVGRARCAVISLALGLAMTLSGCSTAGTSALDTDGLPGVWTGSGGGRVEFHADGRFSMKGIPAESIAFTWSEPRNGATRVSGAGTWERHDVDEDTAPDDRRRRLIPDRRGGRQPHGRRGRSAAGVLLRHERRQTYGYEIRKNS